MPQTALPLWSAWSIHKDKECRLYKIVLKYSIILIQKQKLLVILFYISASSMFIILSVVVLKYVHASFPFAFLFLQLIKYIQS
jgi:hypothetical protein